MVILVLCFQKEKHETRKCRKQREEPLSDSVRVRLKWKNIFHWEGSMVKRILGIAVPNGIENGLFQLTKVALSSITALFGTVQIAANGVAQSFWSVAALMGTALGLAFVTVIGQCMGAGDPEAAEYYMRRLLRITVFASVLWNGVVLLAAPFVLRGYAVSDEAAHLVVILVISALGRPLKRSAGSRGCEIHHVCQHLFHDRVQSGIFSPVRHLSGSGRNRHCVCHVSGLDDPGGILLGPFPQWKMERVPGDRIKKIKRRYFPCILSAAADVQDVQPRRTAADGSTG